MSAVIGQLLPLALGVAISPIPIIAVILMLLTPRAGGTSTGFLLGWIAGIVVATTLFVVLALVAGLRAAGDDPSPVASWIKIVLGVLLAALAIRQWRGRPEEGEEAELPGWMDAIDTFNLPKAAGLGFVLSAVNPKNLILCIGAGAAIGGAALGVGSAVASVAVFTVLAASTVAVSVIAYAVATAYMHKPLVALRTWLVEHNAAVMTVLLAVIGTAMIGQGLGGLG